MLEEIRKCNLIDLFLWLLRRRRRFRVIGFSMFPLLQPGEEVLVDINFKGRNYFPKIGDIVVLNHPEKSSFPIIKRVVKIKETGEFFVQGDNFTVSNDSRHFGTVNSQLIIGKVVCRFA